MMAHVTALIVVCFSVVLAFALTGLWYVFRFHCSALGSLVVNHIAFSYTFLYIFPHLVGHIIPWAPPWAPVCLWYAFLVQLYCTQGPTTMFMVFQLLLPLMFLVEGVSHHSFLLDLTGSEL